MAGDLETYRTADEVEERRAHEPLVVLQNRLEERGVPAEELAQIRAEAEAEVAEAVEFAQESPWPDLSEAYTDVFVV